MIDWSNKFGRHAQSRLKKEQVIWLTTVGSDLTPQPRPVWFWWDGRAFLIFSQPNTGKTRHITARPKVALHLNSDEAGEDVVVLTGRARILASKPSAAELSAYLKKYKRGIAGLDMTPDGFLSDYAVPIRITPTNLRGI